MRRKCHTCLCWTCLNVCKCEGCTGKKESCERYSGFRQLSIFEQQSNPQYQSVPRHSLSYYGLTYKRVDELEKLIRSGKYARLASSVAHTVDNDTAEYILLSITKKISYDGLDKLYRRGEIDRIPCSRTVFYYTKKYFYSLFDKELRRIGK